VAVVLTNVRLLWYACVSYAVNVLDRIPTEHFVTNTNAPSKWLVGEVGYLCFLTFVYAELGSQFLLCVGNVQSVL